LFKKYLKDHFLKISINVNSQVAIVSDNNSYVVNHLLHHHLKLDHLVDQVVTNPSRVAPDEEGSGRQRLYVEPYDHQDNCLISFRNLCKTKALMELREKYMPPQPPEAAAAAAAAAAEADLQTPPFLTAFVGDNRNDLCPAFLNGTQEAPVLVFPRRGHPLELLLVEQATDVRATAVFPWETGNDILNELRKRLL